MPRLSQSDIRNKAIAFVHEWKDETRERAGFESARRADLCDPLTMLTEPLDAHRDNDEAVDACYGNRRFKTELERLEFLFDLYRQYTEHLAVAGEQAKRKAKHRRK